MSIGNNLSKETTDFRLMLNMYAYKDPKIMDVLYASIRDLFFPEYVRKITFEQSPCSHIVISFEQEGVVNNNYSAYEVAYIAISNFFNNIGIKRSLRQIIESNYDQNAKPYLLSALEKIGSDKRYTSVMFNITSPDPTHIYIYI